ncbi:hypothetical protein TIFTF001_007279 [Ficus carica]|uniref:Uncharacterized protein n=1 Tax=Ficus carica TaxID=3494 RepID=A0AA87ZRE0_FICCA|nr:hypothetical protein TIFTF001_007279 [Ficus carica]
MPLPEEKRMHHRICDIHRNLLQTQIGDSHELRRGRDSRRRVVTTLAVVWSWSVV